MVPAGAGLVAGSPVQPVRGVAGRPGPEQKGGEQAPDFRDGPWDHARVGGRRLGGHDQDGVPGAGGLEADLRLVQFP